MEHHVVIEKLCSCAKKEGLSQIVTHLDKASALATAKDQLTFMKQRFCGKHDFDITEVEEHYVIGMVGGGCGCGSHDSH